MTNKVVCILVMSLLALCLVGCTAKTYCQGVYRVGTDIQAGSYVLTEDEEDSSSDAYVAVYTDETMSDYVYGQNFENSFQVNVEDGQVLEVKRATFVAA